MRIVLLMRQSFELLINANGLIGLLDAADARA